MRSDSRGIVLSGTLPMAEMEEPNEQCGEIGWTWKELMAQQKKRIKER